MIEQIRGRHIGQKWGPLDRHHPDLDGALFLVCDGVGGHSAGEVASEHAGQRVLSDYYQAPAEQAAAARLTAAIQQANADILRENAGQPEARMMTTTIVAAVIEGWRLSLAHVGDSRAYLIRAGRITQLTADHSWVAEMVRAGDLTPEEARQHPWRNRITRSLGMKERVVVDSQVVEVVQGDVVLLCSDGLTRHVADAEIAEMVTRQPAFAAGQALVDLAKARGGSDNISIVVAQLLSPDAALAGEAQGAAPSRAAGAPAARRRVPLWVPLALAAAALLLAVALALMYTQTNWLRRQPASTPTIVPTVAPAGASVVAPTASATNTSAPPAGTVVPTAGPADTETPTVVLSPGAPTSTSRPTLTVTRTPLPPTVTQTATDAPTAAPTLGREDTATPHATGLPTKAPSATSLPIPTVPTVAPTKLNPTPTKPNKPTSQGSVSG